MKPDTYSPYCDEGFLYGQGLFETMRCYDTKIFLLERHIKRLIDSCPVMDMVAPKKEILKTAVLETVNKNKLNSGYARLNVWKKNKGLGIFVSVKDMPFYSDKDYERGFSAIIIRDIRQNETSPLVKVKSLNHYFYMLLSKRARDRGEDEAIILNSKGDICEGARSNIFIIKKGKIFTPSIDSGCLPGITRKTAIEMAQQLNMRVDETEIRPKDLFACEEAFLTNSLIEIMPLTKVDAKLIGRGKPGEKTKLILNRYRKLVRAGYK